MNSQEEIFLERIWHLRLRSAKKVRDQIERINSLKRKGRPEVKMQDEPRSFPSRKEMRKNEREEGNENQTIR